MTHLAGYLCLLGWTAGCDKATEPPAGTGAREAAQSYGEAVCRQDWSQAYAVLHPDSRKNLDEDQFAYLAAAYHTGIGFHPTEVRVRSCEEQSNRAIAHLVFLSDSPARQRFKETLLLQKSSAGWGVVLPDGFGNSLSP
jgi:hypothetical protein